MDTILERQRSAHEERERLIEAQVKELLHKKSTQREQINSDHRVRGLLDRYIEVTTKLKDLYEDEDGMRRDEIQALSGPNEMVEFYNRLRGLKDFYKSNPNEIHVPMSMEFAQMDEAREKGIDENLVEFTDEEGYGKYLDLHACYEKFVNIKGVDRIDYITYLGTFDRLFDIPKERKNADYRRYVEALSGYMQDYLQRVKPLSNLEKEAIELEKEFEKQWNSGQFPGWQKESEGALAHTGAHLDLSAFSSAEELASLGLDRLKSALMALGLKCGGTLEERAQRLFSTKGKSMEEIDISLLAKKKTKGGSVPTKNRELAIMESRIYWLVEQLSEQRAATKENVQRRQARTAGERQDSDDESADEVSDDDEQEDVIYNPKNLPLGWDGKPIPYWLYKLHGLNISYTCEICGNFVYKGPKAYQRHFAEWRHAHGMRCLGIPNTAHFANVTNIEDAMNLWQKLQDEKSKQRFHAKTEEEYEDSSGNVVNKKTFEDLKRQGLL
ncbi:splicing factor 3A subunit 3-like [Varroa jacobsoni]|uniref:Matrin-type domain-containing protein n=2 Tax=Varroa destructor TaxID=109461 RepID=A0A7M7J4E8_VARDE|nr:splicing factor 3A subunit 3-like isoform X1 [Varroa destructor]XP_022685927.1 splicing factor 3A subunit 3-like [Varroa jacobsoni]